MKLVAASLTVLALLSLIPGAPTCPITCCSIPATACCEPAACECHLDQPTPNLASPMAAVTPHLPASVPPPVTPPCSATLVPVIHPTPLAPAPALGPPLYTLTHAFLI